MKLLLIILSFIACSNKLIFIDMFICFLSIQIDTCCRPLRIDLRPAEKKKQRKSHFQSTLTRFFNDIGFK